jgi:selenoprotein W-related protein
VGLANDLLKNFEPEIESITLVPSDRGQYEITVNNQLVYSKLESGRHAEPGEVVGLVKKLVKQ